MNKETKEYINDLLNGETFFFKNNELTTNNKQLTEHLKTHKQHGKFRK